MASLQQDPSGNFHICFRFARRRFKRSLKTANKRKADAACTRLDENIRLVDSGRLSLPQDADVATFLLSDGKLDAKPNILSTIRLGKLYSAYQQALPEGALENRTLATIKLHMRHVERILGGNKPLSELQASDLQHYVTTRSTEPGQNGSVSAVTIRKEVATLGTLWNWASTRGLVSSLFPRNGLLFPKHQEKVPFQTRKQIERQIKRDGLSAGETEVLWDCLYLDHGELEELLSFVSKNSKYAHIYPMCLMAAHTGARRSELCRARVDDFDLEVGTVTIHERKRSRIKRTTRLVPLTQSLRDAMSQWFDSKLASPFAFTADTYQSAHSRHMGLNPESVGRQLREILSGSAWNNIRGWHVFRHSFISLCASRGVDQRFIDAWVGHQTDEQRRRYRHLFPDFSAKGD